MRRSLRPGPRQIRVVSTGPESRSWPHPLTVIGGWLTLLLLAMLGIVILTGWEVSGQAAGPLTITPIRLSAGTFGLYERVTLTFDIEHSVATDPFIPYDPAPPPGLTGRTGLTVEGLFLPPGEEDWQQALRQPGFLFQSYDRQIRGETEWRYPLDQPTWQIRFTPTRPGTWRFRARAQDASLCSPSLIPCDQWVESGEGGFEVDPASAKGLGFIGVSPADPRYFAFASGQAFLGQGHNTAFDRRRMTADAEQQLRLFGSHGVDLARVWLSGSGIAGSAWGPWAWLGGPGYGGYLIDPGLAPAPPGTGTDFVFSLSHAAGRLCLINGWTQGPIAVKPATRYRLAITASTAGIAGPRQADRPAFGLTAKIGPWANQCPDDLEGLPALIEPLYSTDWQTVETTLTTTADQYFLDYLYLTLTNTTAGEAAIGRVSLRERRADGSLGPELLAKGSADAHREFDQARSADWDRILDLAAEQGVFLKLVVLEKNDRVWTSIAADGQVVANGEVGNFYAAPGTKVRRLHEYYWRYLAARWGYATAIHSWELINEGDPFDGRHHEQAAAFAEFMHQHEPSRHLVTTSLWHSFPAVELWGNRRFNAIDYADLHAYISTGFGAFAWSLPSGTELEQDPAWTYQASAGALRLPAGVTSGPSAIWVRGRGDWTIRVMVRAEGLIGSCPYGAPADRAGPQLLIGVDSPNTRIVPADPAQPESHWICSAPAGSYDYRPTWGTISLPDDEWHQLVVTFRTSFATAGTAWFDDLQVIAPDGRRPPLLGTGSFDDRERLDDDTALYSEVYGLRYGALSPSGVGKPVIRGEAGIDYAGGPQQELAALAADRHGTWLHHLLWAKLAAGGLYELYWWPETIRQNSLYFQYQPVRDFLADIPLTNGGYRAIDAHPSDRALRVVGQIDAIGGRGHLWLRSTRFGWRQAAAGLPADRLTGSLIVAGWQAGGAYEVEWWQFDAAGRLTIAHSLATADVNGLLLLDLAGLAPETADFAVKIRANRLATGMRQDCSLAMAGVS